jgi:hypothetical protein
VIFFSKDINIKIPSSVIDGASSEGDSRSPKIPVELLQQELWLQDIIKHQ